MENRYKEIASTLLDEELIEPDHLKKVIGAHKKAVKNGTEISFPAFLVDNGLISPEEAEALAPATEQDTPIPDAPPKQEEPMDESAGEAKKQKDFYAQHKQRRSRSRRNTYVIVGIVLAVLGIAVVYAYVQYSQSRSARAAFQKAKELKEEHRYRDALDVVSNQLIDAYPSSSVTSNGKTLRGNIRKILDRKSEIASTVDDLSSRTPEANASNPEEKLKYVKQTVDRADELLHKHRRFLNEHFRSPTNQQADPDLLLRIEDLRTDARERARTLLNTVIDQKKKQIRELIDEQNPNQAFDLAKAFQKNYGNLRDPETTPLSKQANDWIRTKYRDTLSSATEMVKENQADRAIETFRDAMSTYGAFVSEERLETDLKKLQNLRSNPSSSDDENENRGDGVITGDAGGAETDANAVGASNSSKAGEQAVIKKKNETTEIPFNHRRLLTGDGSWISGRITAVRDQQVVVETETGPITTTLNQLHPASASRALSTVGRKQKAIEFALENEAYHAARRLLSGTQQQKQAWRKASVNASNQFLDQVLKMSPQAREKRIARKEQQLERKYKAKYREDDRLENSPVQSINRMVYTGDVSRRLDIVFINDGWTKELQNKYNKLCERLVNRLLNVKPFINYRRYINFHRINVVSQQTDIDGSTELGTKVQGDDNRLISDYGKAEKIGRMAPDTDLVVNVVNFDDGRATGTIGNRPGVITIDKSGRVGATFIHELGHAFGNLDDEYVDDRIKRSYSPDEEDEHINTSRESDPLKVKWHYWRFPKSPPGRVVGTYEGAYYNENGYYRPSPNCRMKSSSSRFCVVCFEQMEKSFYHNVSPLDRVIPFRQSIELFKNEARRLLAHTIVTTSRGDQFGELRANWYLNGKPIENTDSTTLKTWVNTGELSLPPGTHQLGVHINFLNQRVRRDHGYLSDAHAWKVKVRPYEQPEFRIGHQRQVNAGSAFALPLKLDDTSRENGLRVKPLTLPPGAQFDAEQQRIAWTPTPRQTGSHALHVGVVDTNRENELVLERTIRVTVKRPGRNNQAPLMYVPPILVVEEGEPLKYRVNAWDPNNDFLTYRISEHPKGLHINPNTGRIHWKVGYRTPFEKKTMTVTATDGPLSVSKDITLIVKDQPLPGYRSRSGYSAMTALRKRDQGRVKQVFNNQLRNLPRLYQFLESIRLLRHREPSVRTLAIERARTIFKDRKPAMKKRYANILFSTVKPHMFHFTDSPEVLSFLQSMVDLSKGVRAVSSRAKTIQSRLDTIRAYNEKRGVDLESSG